MTFSQALAIHTLCVVLVAAPIIASVYALVWLIK